MGVYLKISKSNFCTETTFLKFFQDSQKNDTTEKIESSKRTNWFIIKNKLKTTVVVLIYANFNITKHKKTALILGAEIEKRKEGFKYLHLEHNANIEQQMFAFKKINTC